MNDTDLLRLRDELLAEEKAEPRSVPIRAIQLWTRSATAAALFACAGGMSGLVLYGLFVPGQLRQQGAARGASVLAVSTNDVLEYGVFPGGVAFVVSLVCWRWLAARSPGRRQGAIAGATSAVLSHALHAWLFCAWMLVQSWQQPPIPGLPHPPVMNTILLLFLLPIFSTISSGWLTITAGALVGAVIGEYQRSQGEEAVAFTRNALPSPLAFAPVRSWSPVARRPPGAGSVSPHKGNPYRGLVAS